MIPFERPVAASRDYESSRGLKVQEIEDIKPSSVVGLRDQWRKDLIRVQRDVGIRSVRCHGLFDDEMGIAAGGAGNFNFLYVDQIYDFMLDHDVRPFVELSFMPEAFARSANRIMAYKGNTSPPREWKDWRDMVHALADHCVKRYGIREVATWKFEVWNEPNIARFRASRKEPSADRQD